jgi:hypothetical protein
VRTQRIFWFLICFIPNIVFAHAIAPDPKVESADATLKSRHTARKTAVQARNTSSTTAQTGAPASGSAATMTEAKLVASIETCETARNAAYYACAEWLSPGIAEFVKSYGTLMSVASAGLGSFSDQCKGIGSLLNNANTVLGAYQVACATAQGICTSKCNGALTNLGYTVKANAKASSEAQTYTSNPATAAAAAAALKHYGPEAAEFISQEKELLVERIGFCQNFQIGADSAIIGMVAAVKGVMTTKKCEEENSTINAGIDCTNPQNAAYNQKSCMCTRNELPAAECQNQVVANTVKNSGVQTGGKVTFDKDGNPVPDFSPVEKGTPLAATDSGSGGLPGAPSGGGGGVGGAGGGTGGGAQDGFAGGGRRLNTNILGGGSGGSGGGAGFGSGAGYGEDPSLRAYKPGGAKDPSRTIASQLAKEVTGQGGRSNWEKVKSRYIDNSGKLLGN